MANLINPKPRFGLDPEANTMFDYVANKDVPVTALYQGSDGQWNLETVKQLILAGKTIETGKLNNTVPPKPTAVLQPAPAKNPVATAKVIPIVKPVQPASVSKLPAGPHPTSPRHGLTAAQIQALAFEPLQLAALGITPKAVKVDGLTADQVAAMHINSERATRLGLTPAQEVALTP